MRGRKLKRKVKWILGFLILAVIGILWLRIRLVKSPEDLQKWPVTEFPTVSALDPAEVPASEESEPEEDTFSRGVWISYLEYESLLTGKSEEEFRESFGALCEELAAHAYDTVIVQVRAHGDAFYESSYFPWASGITGHRETTPDFDPLAVMVELAHREGLLLDAWINPYRLMQDVDLTALTGSYAFSDWVGDASYMAQQDGCWYFNPANEEVIALVVNGAQEILAGYDVDGLHLDDYFYSVSPETYGSTEAEAKAAVTSLVRELSALCRQREVRFVISPAGNFTDQPVSDETQLTSLTSWCEEGLLDAVIPQIYWDFEDETAPFGTLLTRWEEWANSLNVPLGVGVAAYKFDAETLAEQEAAVRAAKTSGIYYFRYDFLPVEELDDLLSSEESV